VASPLEDLLRSHVERGTIPGGIAAVSRPGEAPEIVAIGMPADAIVRIASMTKAVTAVAALRLVESGAVALDSPIEPWIPELADRRVLSSPAAELDDTVPATRPITLRHLLTCTSGYGSIMGESPLQQAMVENATAGGPEPPALGADEWLARLAELPLAFQPGEGWRYHHSFGVLGILLSRITGRPLSDHLRSDLLDPIGMPDTGFWVAPPQAARLPAAHRHGEHGLVETEPAAGGFYAAPPPFDVSHGELVSTASDWLRFLAVLTAEGVSVDGERMLSREHVAMMTHDQVPASAKGPDDFFPGFWAGMGWGFGASVETDGPHAGRYGWSGGVGTDFLVDPDGTAAVLLTQVELGEAMMPLLTEFQAVVLSSR
jgi:CubicO group peptidase (beta-lactamase class C family)